MTKLCKIIALVNGTKGRTQKAVTEAHHKVQKPDLISGIARRYRPKDEDGDQLPPEKKLVHYRVIDALGDYQNAMVRLFDLVATQDHGNTLARASVAVNGTAILHDVPVTTLLFLEKQLIDMGTFLEKIPTLDTSESWSWSDEANCYATEVHQTNRTKKVFRNHVKAEATEQHPAQVEVYSEDVTVGTWDTTKFSGAVPEATKQRWIERARALLDAVRTAREDANATTVEDVQMGKAIFSYLLDETSASSS